MEISVSALLCLDLPEDGNLTAETCSMVQAYVWLLISVLCICWCQEMTL